MPANIQIGTRVQQYVAGEWRDAPLHAIPVRDSLEPRLNVTPRFERREEILAERFLNSLGTGIAHKGGKASRERRKERRQHERGGL